jgi:predicted ribosomally synthesized peptide with nif11-like leader
MSTKNLAKFIEQLQQDTSLQQRLAAVPDKEAQSRLAVELGAQLGYEFTTAEVEELRSQRTQEEKGELDDNELEAVAGGKAKLQDATTTSGTTSTDYELMTQVGSIDDLLGWKWSPPQG